jgi:hypothetical protein
LPAFEPRLQRRYCQLVGEHLRCATPLTPGIAALPRLLSVTDPDHPSSGLTQRFTTAFASTQAAWRFFANQAVTLPELAQPLIEAGRRALVSAATDYALVVHDWSNLNYHRHTAKTDQILFSKGTDRGYELACALLVDAATGDPLAPLELRLRTATALYSTRQPAPPRGLNHLDALLATMRAIGRLRLPRTVVHLVDCEGDSVAHLRRWHKHGQSFLVRTDGTRTVCWRGRETKLPAVVAALEQEGAFRDSRKVLYHGQSAQQTVAETEVVLTRPAYSNRQGKRKVIPGKPLRLRLVISQVRNEAGELLATWYLLTNLPPEVDAEQVALWYYWRWRIESYFKLLKAAGQELENWQQETGAAIAKRLLVASMACVVVWQVARLPGAEGERWRQVLVRLSGRQMKHGVAFTLPALLAGLWVLVAAVEVLRHEDPEELARLVATVLPNFGNPRQDSENSG